VKTISNFMFLNKLCPWFLKYRTHWKAWPLLNSRLQPVHQFSRFIHKTSLTGGLSDVLHQIFMVIVWSARMFWKMQSHQLVGITEHSVHHNKFQSDLRKMCGRSNRWQLKNRFDWKFRITAFKAEIFVKCLIFIGYYFWKVTKNFTGKVLKYFFFEIL